MAWFQRRRGANTTQYALVAGFIAAVAISAVAALGRSSVSLTCHVAESLGGSCKRAKLAITPPAAGAFDITGPATSSGQATATITNPGEAVSDIMTVSVSDPSHFVIDGGTCLNATVAAGGSCTVLLHSQTSGNGAYSATLNVTAGDQSAVASLSGTGSGFAAGLTVNSTSGSLDIAAPSTSSGTYSVVFRNTGNAPTGTISTNLSNTTNFIIDSNGCTGVVLAPATNCTVNLHAVPNQSGAYNVVGAYSGQLTATDGVLSAPASLSGTATGFVAPPSATTCSPGTYSASVFSGQGGCIFSATGGDQAFVVPANENSLTFKLWGGAGGGSTNGSVSTNGGGGGYTTGALAVTSGESLTLIVGNGGIPGFGGGRSAIRRSTTELLTAGAGGGGGEVGSGGAGGGTNGVAGTCGDGTAGGGGTQSSGGTGGGAPAGGTCGFETPVHATAGTQFNGGQGYGASCGSGTTYGGGASWCDVYCAGGGGGGGGGWYGGGGGGGGSSSASGKSCGGGGGSGYCGGAGVSACTTTAGSGVTPANNADADRGTAGVGAGNATGGNGRIIVTWVP